MKIFEIGKEVEAKFPESWEEVTMEQFFKVGLNFENLTNIEFLEALSGIKKEVWFKCSNVNIDEIIMPHLAFIFQNDFKPENYKILESIELSGKKINIPKDLGFETFGQKIICQDEIIKYDKEQGEIFQTIPFIVAVYLQPKIDGKFDEEKAMGLIPEIMQMKAVEIYPIGFFLLMKLIASLIGKLNYLGIMNIQKMKSEQELKN